VNAVFVLAGFLLGGDALGVLDLGSHGSLTTDVGSLALIVILFRDGLEVEAEMLQREWRLPLRKLVLAMPITGALVALATHSLTDLSWTQSFLVGALLSPTDPILSSAVVTNPRVPRVIRHSLNLESGLNDGLALPAVLAFVAALGADHDFVWWKFLLQDVTLGLVFGVAVGFVASLLPGDRETPTLAKGLYALAVAFVAYAAAVAEPAGNGFIGVYVAAIVLGIRRPDIRAAFETRDRGMVTAVKLVVFVVFGSLLTVDGLFADGWAAVGVVAFTLLAARPVAVWLALMGTRTDAATKAFMSWFGPKGIATMTFSLLVLAHAVPGAERIFNLAALAVFTSIVVHGLTARPGTDWIAKRAGRLAPGG
jgi:NhaP-type Na+/H+ or K+/H+ antiporter